MLLVNRAASSEFYEVGMCYVGENARFYAFTDLIDVFFEVIFIVGDSARADSGYFVLEEMLTENEVIDRVAADESEEILEKFGVIFADLFDHREFNERVARVVARTNFVVPLSLKRKCSGAYSVRLGFASVVRTEGVAHRG